MWSSNSLKWLVQQRGTEFSCAQFGCSVCRWRTLYAQTQASRGREEKQSNSPEDFLLLPNVWMEKNGFQKAPRNCSTGERGEGGGGGKKRERCNQKVLVKKKIRYRAQTSCSLSSGCDRRKPLSGISDLKWFPLKSRNKSNKSGEKEGWRLAGSDLRYYWFWLSYYTP